MPLFLLGRVDLRMGTKTDVSATIRIDCDLKRAWHRDVPRGSGADCSSARFHVDSMGRSDARPSRQLMRPYGFRTPGRRRQHHPSVIDLPPELAASRTCSFAAPDSLAQQETIRARHGLSAPAERRSGGQERADRSDRRPIHGAAAVPASRGTPRPMWLRQAHRQPLRQSQSRRVRSGLGTAPRANPSLP